MTERETRVKAYFQKDMDNQYDHEADFLSDAKEMLSMLKNSYYIRPAYSSVAGVADLVVCYKGQFFAFELKTKTGTPSPQQLSFVAKIHAAGGHAIVCRNLGEIFDLLISSTEDES